MAQAEYKNMTKDYRNMNLMMHVGVVLSGWRERYGADEYGEFRNGRKQLTTWMLAKAIGERYEGVYRLEHGGGTSTVLVKYLIFIKQHDPDFDFCKQLHISMKDKYPFF